MSPRSGAYTLFTKTLEKQNEVLERVSRRLERIEGIDQRSPRGTGDVAELRQRVAMHENLVNEDRGKRGIIMAPRKVSSGDGAGDDPGEAFCKVLTSIPRGSPDFGEVTTSMVVECPAECWGAGTMNKEDGITRGD